ncbi:histidine phosphatase family protein [Sphingobacterium sp. DK4209]|uniref:Histidine phosphatase family protein n=1 Tax=Sphingobacterium zhuxiongii TaxID=2662364 RepID=A0A5Q0QA52_9SPHI|nr:MULTISPECIES: histidine phosphatase family protein [unclassified Sphingobacterium]MVZ65080.1 histidine phosphatase family protein [Sphingobacterium sp. DK4209]QGA26029.1 histidine phosphatase family protein [Sphingobacterium sp. dk4302]
MKKTIYFIRHGQTDLNLRGIVQGRGVNSPLNTNGIQQAQAFFEAYKAVAFDKIYASTLLRTHQTVAPFLAQGLEMVELEGLDEISWGIYEGQEQTEEILKGFEQVVGSWRNNDLDLAIPNGESPNTLVRRQKEAIAHIVSQENEETVLVCMHGRALRIMLCHLTEVPVCKMDDFPHTNTALYVLDYEDDKFTIVDYYNTKHLENLLNEKD